MTSQSICLHGVFLHIFGKGILLTGEPGVGKSLTALALLYRGHALIADDLVLLKKEKQQLFGEAPITGFGLMHVRALGFIDVEQLFGTAQVVRQNKLDLIIHLEEATRLDASLRWHDTYDASTTKNELSTKIILEMPIPMQILSIRNSQDMAILIETAVKLALGPKSERVKNFETHHC